MLDLEASEWFCCNNYAKTLKNFLPPRDIGIKPGEVQSSISLDINIRSKMVYVRAGVVKKEAHTSDVAHIPRYYQSHIKALISPPS